MRSMLAFVAFLLVMGAVCADPPPPLQPDPISLDRQSPSVVNFGNRPADIYGEAAGGGAGGWDVGGPGPVLHIADVTYGLNLPDNNDGHSQGHNNPNWLPIVYFSADRMSIGLWNTQYRHQAIRNQAAGDRFVSNGWMDRSPANSYGTGIPANLILWWPGFGPNLLSANQTRYNEIPSLPQSAVNPNPNPQMIDDMDALELHAIDVTGDKVHDVPLFFTLDTTSPSMPPGGSPADIFRSPTGGWLFSIWASYNQMGLTPNDDIDALVVFDVAHAFSAVPGTDFALFSLKTPNSWNASPSDVFVTAFQGYSKLYIKAQTIGLRAHDNLDGLDIEQYVEGQSLPQIFDEIVDPPSPAPVPVPTVRPLPNGSPVSVSGIVTLIGSNYLYIEAPDRSSGIRIEPLVPMPWYVSIGDDLQVIGVLGTVDGERVINPTQPVSPLTSGNTLPGALGLRTRDAGGANYDPMNPGVTNGRGALNVGLRVEVCGLVTAVDSAAVPQWFYVWDGSNGGMVGTNAPLDDGTGNWGVRIEGPFAGSVTPNVDWVEIDGVASTDATAVPGAVIPTVIARTLNTVTAFNSITDLTAAPDLPGVVSGWNLVGLPGIPFGYTAGLLTWDPPVLFSPYIPDNVLFRWEAATSSLIMYDPWDPVPLGGMLLGDGYWLNAASDWAVKYQGLYRPEDQWYTMPIGAGNWCLMGQPFNHNTYWEDVLVHTGMEVRSMTSAAAAGWLSSTGWWWDNSTMSLVDLDLAMFWPSSHKLCLWKGYWLQSNRPQISLIIPDQPVAPPDPYGP